MITVRWSAKMREGDIRAMAIGVAGTDRILGGTNRIPTEAVWVGAAGW